MLTFMLNIHDHLLICAHTLCLIKAKNENKKITTKNFVWFHDHSPLSSMLKLTFDLWYLLLFKSAISSSYEIKENNSRYDVGCLR